MTASVERRLTPPREHVAVPGDGLLHVVPIAAIGVLLLNDHVLKAASPGLVTGKLSDFAGLIFFPLFIQALWELATWRKRPAASLRVLTVACVTTGLVFAAVKTSPIAGAAYSVGLGSLQWLAGVPLSLLSGEPLGAPHAVMLTMDATDLVALPALAISFWVGARRVREQAE